MRLATHAELDRVYLHGRDAWDDGLPEADYLHGCRASEKYAAGTWYVREVGGEPVASLIVYEKVFSLPAGSHGIGSVATAPDDRCRGHATALVERVVADLEASGSRATWLFCDIDPRFYARLGFREVRVFPDTVCMVRGLDALAATADGPVPERF